MGQQAKPICDSCGYKPPKVDLGAGRMNHLTYCGAPALDKDTNEIVTLNYYDKVNDESRYVFYNEIGMFEPYADANYYQWTLLGEKQNLAFTELKFQKQKNFCPKCKTFNLVFHPDILFD